MKNFDWLDFCIPCKCWCCKNENPFASCEELKKLNVEKITIKKDGSCIFQDPAGKCKIYNDRPFECRIFPFDIQEIEGKLFWVFWTNCPASAKIDYETVLNNFENTFSKNWSKKYILEYVKYHKSNQPIKYSKNTFHILREVNWPTD